MDKKNELPMYNPEELEAEIMNSDFNEILAYCKNVIMSVFSLGWMKAIFSVIAVAVAWLFDDARGHYPALVVMTLIVLDSISGMVSAVRTGEGLSSRKSKRIAWKLILYGIAIITGRLVDKTLPTPMFAVVIETFLALTEAQSIIENLGQAGMPIPSKLMKLFTMLKDKDYTKK